MPLRTRNRTYFWRGALPINILQLDVLLGVCVVVVGLPLVVIVTLQHDSPGLTPPLTNC